MIIGTNCVKGKYQKIYGLPCAKHCVQLNFILSFTQTMQYGWQCTNGG